MLINVYAQQVCQACKGYLKNFLQSRQLKTFVHQQKLLSSVCLHQSQQYSTNTNGLIFRQLKSSVSDFCVGVGQQDFQIKELFHGETFTYTYILGCRRTHEAVIIDPVDEMVNRDVKLAKEMKLNLLYGLNTHVHADHVTGTGALKEKLPHMKSVISRKSGAEADIHVDHGDRIRFGGQELECRSTPGHTGGCMTYVLHAHSMVFTGDALLIRACGRTDFQEGSPQVLYDSVHRQIFSLPEDYFVYPAHDYQGLSVSTVGEEKLLNPRLTRSKEGFVQFMKELNLAYPKLIDVSLPANMKCGAASRDSVLGPNS